MRSLKQRPPFRRWFVAAIAAWVAASAIPILWFWLTAGSGSGLSVMIGIAWAVVLGMPLALPGLLTLVLVAWLGFWKLRSWPWPGWTATGLAIAILCLMPFMLAGEAAIKDLGNPVVIGVLASGAIAGTVFRFLLPPKFNRG